MNVEQISIFLENQSGRLAEVAGFMPSSVKAATER